MDNTDHAQLAREKADQLREQGNPVAAEKADQYADAWEGQKNAVRTMRG